MQQQRLRVRKELAKLSLAQTHGIWMTRVEDSELNVLRAQILGPENSPYHNGIFKLEIYIPERYPFAPPSIKFLSKIYHPNIDDNGRICLDLIKMPPAGNWRPTIGLEGLLVAIRMLLRDPNPDDPLMGDIAHEYKHNHAEYFRKAKAFTETYAKG